MPSVSLHKHVADSKRLEALQATALLDSPMEEAFDRLTRLAVRFTKAPVSLVSLVDKNRQFFKSCVGLPRPWSIQRETPLTHSFCQHNRIAGVPLVINDARNDPIFKDNLAVRDLNVIAYLGIPLVTKDAYILGSFCVIDTEPREWSAEEIATVSDIAEAVMTEISLRTEIAERKRAEDRRDEFAALYASLQNEIAARKQAEEAKEQYQVQMQQAQKMEALGLLAGGIAHDFNNILSIILGNAELAIKDVPEGSTAFIELKEVITASYRARDLVRQILTISRHSDNKRVPLHVTPIILEGLKLLRSTISPKIEVRDNLKAPVDVILADPSKVQQILFNLCTNAAHAMKDKGGILEISLILDEIKLNDTRKLPQARPGRYLRLTVADTGEGMTPDIQEKIFDPYFSTKKPEEGTGLGLSVVQGLVESYDGLLYVESEVGKGSRVSVFFQLSNKEALIEAQQIGRLPKGTERILIVDDEQSIVDLLVTLLSKIGYTVSSVNSSAECLQILREAPSAFDMIITDMVMPAMTGTELSEKIFEIRPDMPIILCTGYSTMIDAKKAEAMGIKALLYKPVSSKELASTIRRVFDAD